MVLSLSLLHKIKGFNLLKVAEQYKQVNYSRVKTWLLKTSVFLGLAQDFNTSYWPCFLHWVCLHFQSFLPTQNRDNFNLWKWDLSVTVTPKDGSSRKHRKKSKSWKQFLSYHVCSCQMIHKTYHGFNPSTAYIWNKPKGDLPLRFFFSHYWKLVPQCFAHLSFAMLSLWDIREISSQFVALDSGNPSHHLGG